MMPKGLLVYIAGPYSDDPQKRIKNAYDMAHKLLKLGITPVSAMFWHDLNKGSDTSYEWTAHGLELVQTCDALIRLPGKSKGADDEVDRARELGIPVFTSLKQVLSQTPIPEEEERMWAITIADYGTFVVLGTRAAANQAGNDKSECEGAGYKLTLVPKELEQKVALGEAAPRLEGCRSNLARKANDNYGSEHYGLALQKKNIPRVK